MLYIVATPIGNLGDMTIRGIEVLKAVDYILSEDTRVSRKLLQHYQIDTRLVAYHAHNEHRATASHITALQSGQNIALISDAGTPGISDPGFMLVRAAIAHDVPYTVLPGASAIIPAVVGSGLPCDRFHFEGFLPPKKGRKTRLEFLSTLSQTFVLYVSPHKLLKTLNSLIDHCGPDRKATVIKEISKIHETYKHGTLSELAASYSKDQKIKGEHVLVVAGKPKI